MCILYANMSPGLAGPRSVRLWIEEPSSSRPGAPNPPGLDKIPWQAGEQVYWLEMAEPTYDNVLEEIDRVLERGYGYRVLVGATREGTRMLRNDPDEPLPLGEMVPLLSDRDVRIWWSTNTPNEPMDLLFYGHRASADEDGTPSPVSLSFSRRNNRGPPPNEPQSSDDDSSDDGMNPESSATAAKRGTTSTRTRNSMKKTGTVRRSGPADVDEPESDDDCFSVVLADPASTAIPASPPNSMPSPGEQSSYPCANLNSRALRPGQQTGRETNIKEVSELATGTVNSNGKRDRTAMTEADEPNRPADPVEPPRKIVCTVPTIDPTIMVEQERPHREANQSQLPTERLSPPDSPPPFASNLSDDLAAAASEQILVEASAQHLMMLASEVGQHADTSEETGVSTPERDHYPGDPRSEDVHVDIPVPEAAQESNPSAPSPANESRSGSSTPGKLRLQLPGFPSTLLAAGFPAAPAETHAWSSLQSVSVSVVA